MAFNRTYTYPYPPTITNLAEVEVYLKKLYASLLHGDYSSEEVAGGTHWIPDASGIHYPVSGTTRNVGVGMDSASSADLSVDYILDVTSDSAAPVITISNASDTARDPTLKYRVGASPAVKNTVGVDDSDSDKFKIANLSALGTAAVAPGSFGESLVFYHTYDFDLDQVDLDDFSTDSVVYNGTAGSGAWL